MASRAITPDNSLNFTLTDDRTPVLMVDGDHLPDDELVEIHAGDLARWIVGVLAASADALVEARDALQVEAVTRARLN